MTRMTGRVAFVAFCLPTAFAATTARAQQVVPTPIIPQGLGIADKPRPDYQPIGGRIGSFFLYPTFNLAAATTDNVRDSATDRLSDSYLTMTGDAKLLSNLSNHAVNLDAFVIRSEHTNVKSENGTQYGGSFNGRLDVTRDTKLNLNFVADHRILDRSDYNSPIDARSPVRYDRRYIDGLLTQTLNRFTLTGEAYYSTINYQDTTSVDGSPISQRYRDVHTVGGQGSISYAFRQGISVIVRGSADQRNYTLNPGDSREPGNLDRDSHGGQVEGGFKFDLTNVLYGEVRAGYLVRSYDDPRFKNTSGPSFGVDLLWNVTPLTTMRIVGQRRIDEAAATESAGNRTTEIVATVDHELLRNLLVTAYGRWAHIVPLGPIPVSNEYGARAGLRYFMSRRVQFRLNYNYIKRTSPDPTRAFREDRETGSVLLSF